MVTEVKMEVTEDLSKRVQEIVFTNGGRRNPPTGDIKYLLINCEKCIIYTDKIGFERSYFKEVSAYDFIASQGEQEWLPKYEEEVIFSDDNIYWTKSKFTNYVPKADCAFHTSDNLFKLCKPIPKVLHFVKFLKNNETLWESKEDNCIIFGGLPQTDEESVG